MHNINIFYMIGVLLIPFVQCQSDCVSIKDCPILSTLLKTRKNDPGFVDILKRAHCGENAWTIKTRCTMIKDFVRDKELPKIEKFNCGIEYSETKIVGGIVSQIHETPWLALLKYKSLVNNIIRPACHGSLISKRYVITAAHCLNENAVRKVGVLHRVVLGEYDRNNETDCISKGKRHICADPPKEFEVAWFKLYDGELDEKDIGLIRLKEDVTYTQFIRAICLPDYDTTVTENEELLLAGWGKTENKKLSDIKLKATIPYVKNLDCTQPTKICVGIGNGVDSCNGDSGGPLMVKRVYEFGQNKERYSILIGVVSRGPADCGYGTAIYIRVSTYLDWILQNILN